MQINLIFTRKALHLAFFFKVRVFVTQKWPISRGVVGGGGGGGKGQIEDMQITIFCKKTLQPTGSLGYWYMLQNHSTSLCHLFQLEKLFFIAVIYGDCTLTELTLCQSLYHF